MWQIIAVKQVMAISAKAIKVEIEQDKPPNRRVWIPKSVIDDPDQYEKDDEDVEMHVEEWFAEKENLNKVTILENLMKLNNEDEQ